MDELEALRTKNIRLENENAELRAAIENSRQRSIATGHWLLHSGWIILAGKNLNAALARIFERLEKGQRPQAQELGELCGAIIRRFIRIGMFALLVALAPILTAAFQTLLLWRQNNMMASQNETLVGQNTIMAEQNKIMLEQSKIMTQIHLRDKLQVLGAAQSLITQIKILIAEGDRVANPLNRDFIQGEKGEKKFDDWKTTEFNAFLKTLDESQEVKSDLPNLHADLMKIYYRLEEVIYGLIERPSGTYDQIEWDAKRKKVNDEKRQISAEIERLSKEVETEIGRIRLLSR